MLIEYNPNPYGKRVGDCVIRAISKALNQPWEKTYTEIALQGLILGDMPSSNAVWGAFLKNNGFERYAIPNTCPDCYTVEDFCRDNPKGTYLLALSSHVVTVQDGNAYDIWDSLNEVPQYYWKRKVTKNGNV